MEKCLVLLQLNMSYSVDAWQICPSRNRNKGGVGWGLGIEGGGGRTEGRGGKGNCGPDIKQTNKQIRKIKKKPMIALKIVSFYKKLTLVLKRDTILKWKDGKNLPTQRD